VPAFYKVDTLIINISEIATLPRIVRGYARAEDIGVVYDGFIAIKNGVIVHVGEKRDLSKFSAKQVIDVENSLVTPGLIDIHTHLIYKGSREDEFEELALGKRYDEMLSRGGGIIRTTRETSNASKEELLDLLFERTKKMIKGGITTVEIKSGYGLDIEREILLLETLNLFKELSEIDVVPTLLAHVPPPDANREIFIDLFTKKLIPEAKSLGVSFVDVFCDIGAFTPEETKRILAVAKENGFILRLHADELSYIGCSDIGVELGCRTIDHLNHTPKNIIEEIGRRDIVATLSPTTAMYIAKRRPDIETMMKNKVIIALATDHSPAIMNLDMIDVLNLGAIYFSLPPANLIASVTVNAAYALNLRYRGSIQNGYLADLIIWDLPSYRFIGYERRRDLIKYVMKKGKIIYSSGS